MFLRKLRFYDVAIVVFLELESRTQGSWPRPRTQKKSEAKAKDSLSEDRPSRGQGQECSRPWPRTKNTGACVIQKKVFKNFFQAIFNISTIQKKVCPRAEDRAIFEDLRPRGQGQGLQNVSSRTSSRPKTSSRTPPLFIKTKTKQSKRYFHLNFDGKDYKKTTVINK